MTQPKPKLDAGELASQYGYASTFFNIDPELKNLLEQAVREQWTPDKFKAKFLGTNWYRNNLAAYRNWQELAARSPAEAQQQFSLKKEHIERLASTMGVEMVGEASSRLTHAALAGGWDDETLRAAISNDFKYTGSQNSQGQAATLDARVRGLAGDYGVTVTDQQVGEWVAGVLSGRYADDNLNDFVRDMARSKYPGMRGYLDQGFTVRQVAAPYTQSYAQILEVDPSSVDLTDTHLQKALQGTPDPKTGQAAMQSVYDFERTLRQDSRWQYTKNAHESLTNVGQGILRDMGLYS